MFTTSTAFTRNKTLAYVVAAGLVFFTGGPGRPVPSANGQDAVRPAAPRTGEQPPATIVVEPPLPDLLTRGVAVIRYRTENVQIVPVFGPAAATVSPRIGHLHVTVDDAPWHWVDASGGPVIVAGLPPGSHKVQIELANADHQALAETVVKFEVPRPSATPPDTGAGGHTGSHRPDTAPAATRTPTSPEPKAPQEEKDVTQATATPRSSKRTADKDAIRPFRVNVPEAELTELRKRINATRWPDRETVADTSQGVQLRTMQKLARYWATEYDWRKVEARLNGLPNFVTEIDGLDIHFIHVRSKHADALPLVVTHGWPGSVVEQLKIIGPLTDPTAHGGKASDAFHLVIPSLPGYGFSGKPAAPGWTPITIAKAWGTLMQRLGYTRYVAQGGDWGNAVSEVMALMELPGLLGIHTNMAATVPADVAKALAFNQPPPAGLTAEERGAWDQLDFFYKRGLGYAVEMNNRPQTLYGLADSPVGMAAWMLDHDARSQELIARVFDGKAEGLTRDDVLDNVTLYWVTNTAISSARLYWDTRQLPATGGFFDVRGVKLPVAVSAFPDEIYAAPRSWAEKAYLKLIHYNRPARGGHFAAWEQPALFTDELRAAFRSLR